MRYFIDLVAAAGLMLTAGPAVAQTAANIRELPLVLGKSFEHKPSRLVLPAKIEGLTLGKVLEIGSGQINVAGTYSSEGKPGELVSVYVYRLASGALPIWFDRGLFSINASGVFGTPERMPGGGPFVPPGQSTASGLLATFAVTKPPARSTGIALVALGEWLVKIRYSSAAIAPETLADRIRAVLAALGWPKDLPAAGAVAEVTPCTTPLAFNGASKMVKEDGVAAMASAIMSVPIPPDARKASSPPPPPPVWCRDTMKLDFGALYRANSETDGYLLAVSDAGVAVRVQPNAANIVAKEAKTGAAPNWSVQLVELGRTTNFAPRDRFPSPIEAVEEVNQGRYSSRVGTFGERRIEVNSDVLK